MSARRDFVSLAAVALAFVATLYCLALRHADERAHRRVELAIDVNDVQTLAEPSGIELTEALNRFQFEGRATAAALTEQTIKDLRDQGRLVVYVRGTHDAYSDERGKQLDARYGILLIAVDEALYTRVFNAARAKGDAREIKTRAGKAIALAAAPSAIDDFGVGFDERQVAAVRDAKLAIVARMRNFASLRRQAVASSVEMLKSLDACLVVFAEEEVLGYRDLIPFTANALLKQGIAFGSVEFSKQRGDEGLALRMQGNLLRVHSITEKELPLFKPRDAVERFARAVEERNIRVCYLRMLKHLKHEPLAANIAYVRDLHDELERVGFRFGNAQPTDFRLRTALLALVALGVVAGTVLLLDWLAPLSLAAQCGLLALGEALATALIVWSKRTETSGAPDVKGLCAVALVAGLVFPCLALARSGLVESMRAAAAGNNWGGTALAVLTRASCWSVLGGLFIGALLADWKFMTQTEQFVGVKAAQFLPLLFALFVFILEAARRADESPPQRWQRVRSRAAALLERNMKVGVALLGTAALVGMALWLARTGNQPGIGVSELEMKVRSLLENALMVRPRTKEFAFGHPALVVAVYLAARGRREWAAWCAVCVAVGQAGMLNSFCHLHTPIAVAVLRSFNGLWLGSLVGIVICAALKRLGLARASDGSVGQENP